MSALIREEHIALEAWKPAKNAGSHIPTAAASTASKGIKSQIPRQMRGFTLSCAEPFFCDDLRAYCKRRARFGHLGTAISLSPKPICSHCQHFMNLMQ